MTDTAPAPAPRVYLLDHLGRVAVTLPRLQPIHGTEEALGWQVEIEVESFPVGVMPYDVQAHHMAVMMGEAAYKPEVEQPMIARALLVWVGADDSLAYMVPTATALEPGCRVQIHGVRPDQAAAPESARQPSIWTEGHRPPGLELWTPAEATDDNPAEVVGFEVPEPAYLATVCAAPESASAPPTPDVGTRAATTWLEVFGATGIAYAEALAEIVPFEVGTRVYFTAQPGRGITAAVEAAAVEVFPEARG